MDTYIIPASGRWKQEDLGFKVIFGYTVYVQGQPGVYETLSRGNIKFTLRQRNCPGRPRTPDLPISATGVARVMAMHYHAQLTKAKMYLVLTLQVPI